MKSWYSMSFGALRVSRQGSDQPETGVLVAPVVPTMPLYLFGPGAEIWDHLSGEGVTSSALSAGAAEIIAEMHTAGLATQDRDHRARTPVTDEPWLSSPTHELVYAIIGHVAAELGIRIMFIKGPVLHAQGVRDREHSGDVDCWVEPGNDVRLAEALKAWGWQPAYSAFTGTRVLHSLTLRAPEWGCAIDVHSWYPGMAMEREDAFDFVYANCERQRFAGFEACVPVAPLHAVLAALHEMRPLRGVLPSARQTELAADMLRRGGQGTLDYVRSARAEYALAAAVRSAFPDAHVDGDSADVPADWPRRMKSRATAAYWEAFKLVPLAQRARVVFRVIWPTLESLRNGPFANGHESASRIRGRRALVGLRMLLRLRR